MARFDCAVWRPIGANTGGGLSPNLGLALHHQAGNGSLFGFFNNPAAQVSAHFWVSKAGAIEQYVDTDRVAWHGRDLNSRYVGVETEGCATAPHAEPMTPAMVDAMARLYAEGMRRHGWLPQLAQRNGERGFGFHRMAVNTACPCDVRLNMRDEIIRRARGGPAAPPSGPAPGQEDDNMVLGDPRTRGVWVAFRDGAVHALDGAPFLGAANNDRYNAGKKPCVGIADNSGDGYVLVLDFGNRDLRTFHFPRDGSSRV